MICTPFCPVENGRFGLRWCIWHGGHSPEIIAGPKLRSRTATRSTKCAPARRTRIFQMKGTIQGPHTYAQFQSFGVLPASLSIRPVCVASHKSAAGVHASMHQQTQQTEQSLTHRTVLAIGIRHLATPLHFGQIYFDIFLPPDGPLWFLSR